MSSDDEIFNCVLIAKTSECNYKGIIYQIK